MEQAVDQLLHTLLRRQPAGADREFHVRIALLERFNRNGIIKTGQLPCILVFQVGSSGHIDCCMMQRIRNLLYVAKAPYIVFSLLHAKRKRVLIINRKAQSQEAIHHIVYLHAITYRCLSGLSFCLQVAWSFTV